MKDNIGLVEWAHKFIGHPYWFGTFGQVANENLLQNRRNAYPSHYRNNRLSTYRSHFGEQVFDCSGLIKGYLWYQNGTIRYNGATDFSADRMLAISSRKGKINTIPDILGVLVHFRGHVGIYVGDGNVIEARGFEHGVVKRPLNQGAWVDWSMPNFIEYKEGAIMARFYERQEEQEWMTKGGHENIDKLAEREYLNNPERWKGEVLEAVPQYLIWIMLAKMDEKIIELEGQVDELKNSRRINSGGR